MSEQAERIRRESRMTTFSDGTGSTTRVIHEPTGIETEAASPIAAELDLCVRVLAYEELMRRAAK